MHTPTALHPVADPPDISLAPALEDTLRWLRPPLPEDALVHGFPEHPVDAIRAALEESILAGRVVRSARGWLRLNPVFRGASRRTDAARTRARVVVREACRQAPADLDLRVAYLTLVDWDRPGVVAETEAFFDRVCWGLRAGELVDKLDEADLFSTLVAVCPRAVLVLMVEGGRLAQARPLIGGHDRYLCGLLAFHEGRHADARAELDGVAGLQARFLRLELLRTAFDYDAMEAELERIPADGLEPMPALRRAYYWHRLASYRAWWDKLPGIESDMWMAANATGDGSLQCRVLDAQLAQTLRRGDVPASVALLSELERLVGEGWSPGLQARLALNHGFVADLAGDHLRFRAALARPFSGASDDLFRQLQTAALHVLEGDATTALASPAVRKVAGMEAQFLATVGRFDLAHERVSHDLPGFAEQDLRILRGPIAARLGIGELLSVWPHITPYQECKVALSNVLVALGDDDLDLATTWADRGLSVAGRKGLWDLGASLLVLRADIAVRQGKLEDAESVLVRFDELGRHAHDYLQNLVTVARARIADEPPDGAFVERLVSQQDRVSLVVLAARWPVGEAAERLLSEVPEVACEQLEAAFLVPRSRPVLTLRAEGRQVELPDGRVVDLRRSGAPRRLLVALARHQVARPGAAMDGDQLIAIGWPGERMNWESARTRLYTVVRRLRARGIEGVETVDGGYRLSPEIDVVFAKDTSTG